MFHFCDILMQFDEADCDVFLGNGGKAVFDGGTFVRLCGMLVFR